MTLRRNGRRERSSTPGGVFLLALALWPAAVTKGASPRLSVVTPNTVGLGEDVRIKWDYDDGIGGSSGRFDIALYKCDDAFCGQADCGDFVQDICSRPTLGCASPVIGYLMTVPTDLTAGDSFKIRVGLHGSSLFDCTSTFSIVESIPVPALKVHLPVMVPEGEEVEEEFEGDDDASEVVETLDSERMRALQSSSNTSPELEGESIDYLTAGEAITVSWTYDDGFGGSFARFNIDLYYCGGGCSILQDCGEIVTRLCEACPDSSGDEMVVLPDGYSSHNYKIRVSTWEGVQRQASACSDKFEIRGQERPDVGTPSPTVVSDNSTSLWPRPAVSPVPAEDLPSEPEVLPSIWPDWGGTPETPAKPDCDSSQVPTVRYAATTGRMYVENDEARGGCVTLGQIWEEGDGNRPLFPVDPDTNERVDYATGVWLLTEELYIEDGVTLEVHGSARGGDCDELRLLSNETTFINLRAYGGSLSFLGTKVVSWNEDKGMVDTNHEDGRSYISAVSEVIYDTSLVCNGSAKETMGEARMDVIDSEIAYLGYYESESYGLVWKVRGFCTDKSNEELFDYVNVTGDIINSDIHHNYFGHYSYGHQGGNWSYNKMHNNVMYGFDPHDDSDYLTITGNDVWGNGNHGIIASKRCDHVIITDNHVSNGVNTGLFLHRSSDFAIVSGNHVHSNGDAGLAVLESFYLEVYDNTFKDNEYGIRFSVGAGYNWIHDNVVSSSDKYNLFTYLGSDLPYIEGTSGYAIGNVFWRNYVGGTYLSSLRFKESNNTVVVNNRIRDAATIQMTDSLGFTYRDNEEEDYLIPSIKGDTCFTQDSTLEPKC